MSLVLLKQVSTQIQHFELKLSPSLLGELCALMGPSGSGKTTLLDILARRNLASGAKTLGTSVVNGKHPSLDHFRQLSSYVEQEDALIGSLTVRETMHFAARLAHKK